MTDCDVCGIEFKDEPPYQAKLDNIEPKQGSRLIFCEECAHAVIELAECNPASKLEAIGQLLLSLVDLQVEEFDKNF